MGQEPPETTDTETILHASCVARNGRAVLIRGASGSGKSGLALWLMAMGAGLVADDRTIIRREGNQIIADVPDTIRGKIEARQVGILTAPTVGPVPVRLIVEMDAEESERLPPQRNAKLLGIDIPLVRKSQLPHFPAAILTYLTGTRDA